jgi:hypothetical protein
LRRKDLFVILAKADALDELEIQKCDLLRKPDIHMMKTQVYEKGRLRCKSL